MLFFPLWYRISIYFRFQIEVRNSTIGTTLLIIKNYANLLRSRALFSFVGAGGILHGSVQRSRGMLNNRVLSQRRPWSFQMPSMRVRSPRLLWSLRLSP